MELGSAEHKQLLIKGILRVALKTALTGLIIGVLLMVPSIIRENAFSIGLGYAGLGIIIGSFGYASLLAWKKYQTIIKTFDETFNSSKT